MRLSTHVIVARDARTLIAGAGTLLTAAVCGCSTTTGPASGTTGPSTGSLTVTIAAPSGVTPAVTVAGPNDYNQQLAVTTTLTDLPQGIYYLTPAEVSVADAIVGTTYAANGGSVFVSAGGQDSGSVTYFQVGGTGGLWIANSNSIQTVQFSASQLAATTSAAAAGSISTGRVGNFGAAVDPYGDLTISTFGQNTVEQYSPYQLSVGGIPEAIIGLTVPGAAGVAFDPFDGLWVANNDSSALWEYSSVNLWFGYPPFIPDVVISPTLNSMSGPTGIAFDSHGNLWVANGTGNTLVEYSAAQQSPGGELTPAITLTANGNSIHGPLMIAFDASGDLWVANGNQVNYSSVVEFSAAQLAASGSRTPVVTLTPNAGSLNQPAGLAFDNSGNLWVSNMGANTVVEFTPSQIASSGSPTPRVIVSGASLNGPVGLAFDPPPSNLPVAAERVARRAPSVSRVSPRGRR